MFSGVKSKTARISNLHYATNISSKITGGIKMRVEGSRICIKPIRFNLEVLVNHLCFVIAD